MVLFQMAARGFEQKLAQLAQRLEDIAKRLDAVAVERASKDILTVAAELIELRKLLMGVSDEPADDDRREWPLKLSPPSSARR